MKVLTMWKNETTGTYTLAVDAMITHECLAADEVVAVINEIMQSEK